MGRHAHQHSSVNGFMERNPALHALYGTSVAVTPQPSVPSAVCYTVLAEVAVEVPAEPDENDTDDGQEESVCESRVRCKKQSDTLALVLLQCLQMMMRILTSGQIPFLIRITTSTLHH